MPQQWQVCGGRRFAGIGPAAGTAVQQSYTRASLQRGTKQSAMAIPQMNDT